MYFWRLKYFDLMCKMETDWVNVYLARNPYIFKSWLFTALTQRSCEYVIPRNWVSTIYSNSCLHCALKTYFVLIKLLPRDDSVRTVERRLYVGWNCGFERKTILELLSKILLSMLWIPWLILNAIMFNSCVNYYWR
jgi:hypothetical protein